MDAVGRIDPDKDVGIGGRGFEEEASVSAMMLRRSTLFISKPSPKKVELLTCSTRQSWISK